MGIPKFLNYLKATYKNTDWIKNTSTLEGKNKWDYLFLDYQSLIYSTYEVFYSDINLFIRHIHNMNSNMQLSDFAKNITYKYPKYFSKILNNLDRSVNTLQNITYNNNDIIEFLHNKDAKIPNYALWYYYGGSIKDFILFN